MGNTQGDPEEWDLDLEEEWNLDLEGEEDDAFWGTLLCTCEPTKHPAWDSEDHEGHCELLGSVRFRNGELIWSEPLKMLLESETMGQSAPKTTWKPRTNWATPAGPPPPPCHVDKSQAEFVFADDETKIYLSRGGAHQLQPRIRVPDLHIMLAQSQRAIGIAWYVDWPDYGLPTHSDHVMWAIVDQTCDMLLEGKFIETGCMAAHGRTGTFVGLLDLQLRWRKGMALPESDELVEFVRKRHCSKAVESDVQRWYLDVYRAHLRGEEPPAKPEKKPKYQQSDGYNQSMF